MFDPEIRDFLESGCALILGTVAADGEPHVVRGWGLTVLSGDQTRVRVLVEAENPVAIANLGATGAVAVTAVNVRTFRGVQLKGRAVVVEDGTDADRARAAQYRESFFAIVHEVEGTALELLRRLNADDYAACEIEVDEWFDQTPGPSAGTAIGAQA